MNGLESEFSENKYLTYKKLNYIKDMKVTLILSVNEEGVKWSPIHILPSANAA